MFAYNVFLNFSSVGHLDRLGINQKKIFPSTKFQLDKTSKFWEAIVTMGNNSVLHMGNCQEGA
jgi:hypothetical protein